MDIINGKEIAQRIINLLKAQPKPQKILVAVLIGNDPTSISFLRQKQKIADELGVNFKIYRFDESIAENDLIKEIKNIGESENTGGIIVQLPLPKNLNRENILNAIPKEKDVDVLSDAAKKDFREGKSQILPPAIEVVKEILKTINYKLETNRTAVVGLGFLVGKPISEWLKGRTKELHLLDIDDSLDALKNSDLVITGVGRAGLIKPGILKNSAIVIDFGYNLINGKISGDFDTGELKTKNSKLETGAYTPTPGGTGPILVAKLFENFYKLNK